MLKKLLIATVVVLGLVFAVGAKAETEINLNSDNTLVLNNEVDFLTTAAVMKRAQEMDAKLKSGEPIYLVLDTPGGSIQSGLEMITFLKSLNRPVHTVTIFAASMGFQTVQGLGKRYITRYGTLMVHKAKGGFYGEFPGQIDSRYLYYLKRLDDLDKAIVERSGGKIATVKDLQNMYENEYWADGFTAVEVGLADELVNVKCDHSLNGIREEALDFMGFTVVIQWSQCPTITGPVGFQVNIHTNNGTMKMGDFLAKGGKFPQTAKKSNDDYGYSSYSYSSDSELSANVPDLNVDMINKKIEELKVLKTTRKPIVKMGDK